MAYSFIEAGPSRSFPAGQPIDAASDADVVIIAGADAGRAYAALADKARYRAILVELDLECLGEHTGEARGEEGGNTLGFARFVNGRGEPSNLFELVRQPATEPEALAAARAVLEGFGHKVAVCADVPGRIINRLVRPYYNVALTKLDEGLATAGDLDMTVRLGLGYPAGPIELLETTGLDEHYRVTQALYVALGDPDFAPARRAQVAHARKRAAADDAG